MRKVLSYILCAATLLSLIVIPSFSADYSPADGAFIFDSAKSLSYLTDIDSVNLTYDTAIKTAKAVVNKSGSACDPRATIDLDGMSPALSADEYRYLVITYMVPSNNSPNASVTEVFLSAGDVAKPTAGKSITYQITKSSDFVSAVLDLGSVEWWHGDIHSVRLDFFSIASKNDVYYLDSVILCKTSAEANDVMKDRTKATSSGGTEMPADYYCTSYENDKYTSPFWKGNIVYNEAVYPIKSASGDTSYQLMYAPDQVVSVYDAQFKYKYREGLDYTVSGNKITFLKTGTIPLKAYTYLHPENRQIPSGYSGWQPYYKRHAAGDGKYDYWDAVVASQYINVTYTHKDTWQGPVPAQHADALPRTAAAIKNKSSLNIVYYGDSLCGGARSSSYQNLYPYAEWWNQQITTTLKNSFGVNVRATYSSVGGSTASSMSDSGTISQYVTPYSPDLVVIEFGVNDAQNEAVGGGSLSGHKSTYKSAVQSIISRIRQSKPNCEFLLVAPYYSNTALFAQSYFDVCRDACNEIAAKTSGVAVADVTTFHNYLLGFKNYVDFSGDNLCHPNDYMSRIFAQVCLEAIVPGGVPAYVPEGEIPPVIPDDPDEPDDPGEPDVPVVPAEDSYAAPSGHGWYWSEDYAYGFINEYGGNGPDVKVTCDLCLLPATDESCANLFTDDETGGLWVYPDRVKLGSTTKAYDWGSVSWGNWHTVTFAIKNGTASITIDGQLILSANGFKAHEEFQLLFSRYGSMAIDNLSVTDFDGNVFYSDDFENKTKSQNHLGGGFGEYTALLANTIKYDVNGGTGSIKNQIKVADVPMALTSVTPVRSGYVFSGWATSKTATAAQYAAGATYTGNSSVTLYAVWQEAGAHTHVYGEWYEKTAPSCTEPGVEARTCSCGAEETRNVPAKGHVEGEAETVPATCTENGRSVVKCKVCGYPISDIPIVAPGHNYVNGKCTVCGSDDPDYKPLIKGDIDGDGKITFKDANIQKNAFLGSAALTGDAAAAADINGDGKLSSTDVNALKQLIVGSDS